MLVTHPSERVIISKRIIIDYCSSFFKDVVTLLFLLRALRVHTHYIATKKYDTA